MGRFLQYLIFGLTLSFSVDAFATVLWQGETSTGQSGFVFNNYNDALTWCVSNYAKVGTGGYNTANGSPTAISYGYSQLMTRYYANGTSGGSAGCNARLQCASGNTFVAGTPPSCTCPTGGTAWGWSGGQCISASCSVPAGQNYTFNGTGGMAGSVCGSDYCSYAPAGAIVMVSGEWGGNFASTGNVCSPTSTAPLKTSPRENNVVSAPSGTASVSSKTGCGTVNGQPFCIGAVAPGTCAKGSTGMVVCNSQTSGATTPPAALGTPPAPNTGTAGTAATPIATVQSNGSVNATGGSSGASTTTVFSAAAGAGSTVAAPTQQLTNNSGTGAAGTADHVIVDSGSGSSSTVGTAANPSVQDCTASGTCTNATNSGATTAPTDAKDFGQALTDFRASVASSPVASAFTAVGASIPTGGSAPSATLAMFGRSYTLAVPDAVSSPVTSVLSLLMKAVWSLIAIRRFMAA